MRDDSDSSLVVEGAGRRFPPRELSGVSVLHRLFHSRQHGRDCGGSPWTPATRILEKSFVVESVSKASVPSSQAAVWAFGFAACRPVSGPHGEL